MVNLTYPLQSSQRFFPTKTNFTHAQSALHVLTVFKNADGLTKRTKFTLQILEDGYEGTVISSSFLSLIIPCADLPPRTWQFLLEPGLNWTHYADTAGYEYFKTFLKTLSFPEHLSHSPSETLIFPYPSYVLYELGLRPSHCVWGKLIIWGQRKSHLFGRKIRMMSAV